MAFWDWLNSDDGARAVAGIAGASVSAALEWAGIFPTARKVFIGSLSAYYLGPVGVPIVSWAMAGMKLDPAPTVSGFLMGLVGITIVEIFIRAFRLKRDEIGRRE